MSSVDYFRVVDLGQDLLEYLTLYFDSKESHPLLFVSTIFHDVFARSVWRVINRRTIDMAEPTRSAAFARYGRLVRSINLRMQIYHLYETHDWSELFPNTTKLIFNVDEWLDKECKDSFFDAITTLHGLRSVDILIEDNYPPFNVEHLAKALIKRNQDRSNEPVHRLDIAFADHLYNETWRVAHDFVKDVEPLNLTELRVRMRAGDDCPTPAQFAALRQYLTETSRYNLYSDTADCFVHANRNLFSPSGSANEPLVFPQLQRFGLRTCCSSPDICDYSDFTPAKFPSLYSLELDAWYCPNMADGNELEVAKQIVLQHWPKLEHLTLGRPIGDDFLGRIFEYHPKLSLFNTRLSHEMLAYSSAFKIERILKSLPYLNTLCLDGQRDIILDTEWTTGRDMERIATCNLNYMEFSYMQLSSRLLDFLLRLPKLVSLRLWDAVLADNDTAISVLKQVQAGKGCEHGCGIKDLYLSIVNVEESWPTNLVLELVAAMPQLEKMSLHGSGVAATVKALCERFPHLSVNK
ncbi:hypothetical protein GQ42DRAFT_60077 [Ramicandelaber brevisporus]|nr:hypothetical protein GQ42DRAFT_60077 [Ramicandelaber brevisporus]